MNVSAVQNLTLICVFLLCSTSFAQQCFDAKGSGIHISIRNRRNSTGHRHVEVHLESRAEPGSARNLGSLEADNTVSLCDGIEIHRTEVSITAEPLLVRPADYELFPGLGYYKLHPTAVTWDEARRACAAEGAQLFVPNSEEEAGVAKQLLGRKMSVEGATWQGWAYVGFHDRAIEGAYTTMQGQLLKESGYEKWHPGQPDNKPWGTEPDQDCGSLNTAALLNDLPCLGKLPFICEQSL